MLAWDDPAVGIEWPLDRPPNLTIIDRICESVDGAFASDLSLAARFRDAPAARGEPGALLKSLVDDRAGHDRRYAIDETRART